VLTKRASDLERVTADIEKKTAAEATVMPGAHTFLLKQARNQTWVVKKSDGSVTYNAYTSVLTEHHPTEDEPWYGYVLTITWQPAYQLDQFGQPTTTKIGSFPDNGDMVQVTYHARDKVEGAQLTSSRFQLDLSAITTPIEGGDLYVQYNTKTDKLLNNENPVTDA
jgi:hypothetical protein